MLNNKYFSALDENFAIISFNINGTILHTNKKFLEIFQYKEKEIIGKHHSTFCDKKYVSSDEYIKFWHDISTGLVQTSEFKRLDKNGNSLYIQASYIPLRDENNNIFEIVKFAQDITEQKQLSLYYHGQHEAINKSQAVIEFDMKGYILTANKIFLDSLGYTLDEITGKHHSIFCNEEYTNSNEYQNFWASLNEGKFNSGKFLRIGKNGKKIWIQATYTPILGTDNSPIKVIKFAQDITQFELMQIDELTNLFSREKLILDINNNEKNNLAIIDIDDFSSINDFYGRNIGDKLLVKFSDLLKFLVEDKFSLYRIYGDKFAILNNTYEKTKFFDAIKDINNTANHKLIDLDIKKINLVTTCGISSEDNIKLINTAEIANKYAKKIKKNILSYSSSLNIEKEYENNIYWSEKIRIALKENRIILYFQPIYNNFTNKIEKYESLVRLIEEDGKVISPYLFLDIAKKSKQYLDITKVVIEESFKKFENLDFEFSINLTVEDILDEELISFFFNKIKEYNIANKLVIELVESEKITSYEPVYEFISQIKKLGCKLAIDDFGSGYSNFEYLVKIDADFVKIDGSIIKQILFNQNSYEIVKSIIQFCDKMSIKVIAEFISSEELFNEVSKLGIMYSQGYYIGIPQKDVI